MGWGWGWVEEDKLMTMIQCNGIPIRTALSFHRIHPSNFVSVFVEAVSVQYVTKIQLTVLH